MGEVVVAVVTGPRGVLVGQRHDRDPPWTFPGGKVEPGETPSAAACREVLEEAGIEVMIVGELGRRVHPRTGRTVIYLVARPVGEPHPRADGRELTTVKWAEPTEVELLMPDLFEAVRSHLQHRP